MEERELEVEKEGFRETGGLGCITGLTIGCNSASGMGCGTNLTPLPSAILYSFSFSLCHFPKITINTSQILRVCVHYLQYDLSKLIHVPLHHHIQHTDVHLPSVSFSLF